MRCVMGTIKVAVVMLGAVGAGGGFEGSGRAEGWRLGADVFGAEFLFGSFGVGGLRGVPFATASLGLERQLSTEWWLYGRVGGGFQQTDDIDSYAANLSLGVRFVANPGDRVRIGWTFGLEGSAGSTTDLSDPAVLSISQAQAVALKVGVTADVTLTESLELRLAAELATIGFQHQLLSLSDADPSDSTWVGGLAREDTGFAGRFGVAPQIGIGLVF